MLGEEFGTRGASARRWIVDPIDGTKNYARGIPVWATLIALEHDGATRSRRGVGARARDPVVGEHGRGRVPQR